MKLGLNRTTGLGDLFSSAVVVLPGFDEPAYNGVKSSICKHAQRLGYYNFTYAMAERVNVLKDDLLIRVYNATKQPVSNADQLDLLMTAIKKIYKNG